MPLQVVSWPVWQAPAEPSVASGILQLGPAWAGSSGVAPWLSGAWGVASCSPAACPLVGHSHILPTRAESQPWGHELGKGGSPKLIPSLGTLLGLWAQAQLSLYLLLLYTSVANPLLLMITSCT